METLGSGLVCGLAVRSGEDQPSFATGTSATEALRAGIKVFASGATATVLIALRDFGPGTVEVETFARDCFGILEAVTGPGLFVTLGVQDTVRDSLEVDARFEDFGFHESRPGGRTERLFFLTHPEVPAPVRPIARAKGNCPRPKRSFQGRRATADTLQGIALEHRLITVVGPPGVGKSSLTLYVVRGLAEECQDGIWWFSVVDCFSLEELLATIGSEMALSYPHDLSSVASQLAGKQAVIVLDGAQG